jgi:hypothetical protein
MVNSEARSVSGERRTNVAGDDPDERAVKHACGA